MAKKTNEPFDPNSWLNQAPVTKEERKKKRRAEREEKKAQKNKKANIPTKKVNDKPNKHNNKSNVKYGIVVSACVVAIASAGAWAFVSHNKNAQYNADLVATAQAEVQKATEEAKKEEEKKYTLTQEDYDNNVKVMVKGIKTLTKKDNGDISGYFISNGKYYNVVTYDRETGQIYVLETDGKPKDKDIKDGKPLVLGKEWVNTLIVRLEAESGN